MNPEEFYPHFLEDIEYARDNPEKEQEILIDSLIQLTHYIARLNESNDMLMIRDCSIDAIQSDSRFLYADEVVCHIDRTSEVTAKSYGKLETTLIFESKKLTWQVGDKLGLIIIPKKARH